MVRRGAATPLLAVFVPLLLFDFCTANHGKTFFIHWNTTNSIFRIDNTDHVFDLNKGNSKFDYDQVNILCPVYTPDSFDHDTQERYIIYNVSKEEYDTCRITNPNPRIIAVCDKPQKLMFFTITFRPFSPQPGGLEFSPGKDYYFISTSSRDDLHRRIGGWCSSHNMKLVFRVCCPPEESSRPPESRPPSETPSSAATPAPSPPPTTPPSTARPTAQQRPAAARPTKKSSTRKQHDKAANEVVKSEELSRSGGRPTAVGAMTVIATVVATVAAAALLRPAR